jgi:hypothetical protein
VWTPRSNSTVTIKAYYIFSHFLISELGLLHVRDRQVMASQEVHKSKDKKEKKPKFFFEIKTFASYPNVEVYTYAMNVKIMKDKTVSLYEADLTRQCDILDKLKQTDPAEYSKVHRVLWLDFTKVMVGDPKLSKRSADIMSAIEPRGHFQINILLASIIAKTVLDQIFSKTLPTVPTVVTGSNHSEASKILLPILSGSLHPESLSKEFYAELANKHKS